MKNCIREIAALRAASRLAFEDSPTAGVSGSGVRFNRQLHPDERKWAKDNAQEFAAFYKDKTGQDITVDQAQNMLLANG